MRRGATRRLRYLQPPATQVCPAPQLFPQPPQLALAV
jgi:hypothetical protein